MNQEGFKKVQSGYVALGVLTLLIIAIGYGTFVVHQAIAFLSVAVVLLTKGFFLVNPNTSKVLLLFGKYVGTVKENGFFWANPFYTRRDISLRASSFDSERVKVNDKLGNPIMISTILVWRVNNTYKAAFDVNNSPYAIII